MKTQILILTIGLLFTVACGSSENYNSETIRYGTTVEVDNPDTPLEQYINRLSGVTVFGSGNSARIEIRGANYLLDGRPLYLVDGIQIGRDFSEVKSMVNMANVESVQFMSPSRASQIYGADSGFGAIIINMKR